MPYKDLKSGRLLLGHAEESIMEGLTNADKGV